MSNGVTIASQPGEFPFPNQFLTVYLKENWDEGWTEYPEINVETVSMATGGGGGGSCKFNREYGRVKYEFDDDYDDYDALYLDNWYIRIVAITEQVGNLFGLGVQSEVENIIFTGIVSSDDRVIEGGDVRASGIQNWVGFDATHLMRKVWVSESYWMLEEPDPDDADGTVFNEKKLGRNPSMNIRDDAGLLRGNRSDEFLPETTVYGYGGKNMWNRREYVEYLLAKFFDFTDQDGPKFTLGGQADILEDVADIVDISPVETGFSILNKLITPTIALDYFIRESDEGFSIEVFSLISEEISYGEKTLKKNPNIVRMENTYADDVLDILVSRNDDHKFSKVKLVGERIVTLRTMKSEGVDEDDFEIEKKWTDDLELTYQLGGPGSSADEHDTFRKKDRFRNVFTTFGAKAGTAVQAPILNEDGTVPDDPEYADYQNAFKNILSWTPLVSGFNYEDKEPVDENPAHYTPEFIPPMVFIYDEIWGWSLADAEGANIYALKEEWGFRVQFQPNHIMALNHWSVAYDTGVNPEYDWQKMIMTFAVATDQRLTVEFALTNDDDGSVLEIYIPGMELWYMPKGTVYDVNDDTISADFIQSSENIVLRNDADQLHLIMAGIIARYFNSRAFGTMRINRYVAWGGFIGYILTVIDENGDAHQIQSPITSIIWSDGTTTIRTGYA